MIPDTSQFSPAEELSVTSEQSIGSYVGVPIVLSGGRVYGVLCCYSSHPDPSLAERRLEVIRLLGHLVADTLETEETRWRRNQKFRHTLQQVIDGGRLEIAYQPIIDLKRGTVVGYEALSRFPGPLALRPEQWFLEADRVGLGGVVEARVIDTALTQGRSRPANTFLSINVSPGQVNNPDVQRALMAADLDGIVLEITEHQVVGDYRALGAALATLRDGGARIAVDDAGAGYAGLQQLLGIRPDFIKLDKALVQGIDRDEAKLVLAEALGTFAGRIDAWLIAEGIETTAELDACIRLEVPLGQGWGLGAASPPWLLPEAVQANRVRDRASTRAAGMSTLAPLVEDAPTSPEGQELEEVSQTCD